MPELMPESMQKPMQKPMQKIPLDWLNALGHGIEQGRLEILLKPVAVRCMDPQLW